MAWPNSWRQTEKTQRIVTVKKQAMLFCGHNDVVSLAFAQQQVLAEDQIVRGHHSLRARLADIVDIHAASFDVLSRLTFAGGQTGMNQQFDQRHILGLLDFFGRDFANDLVEDDFRDTVKIPAEKN